jgi:hypothetical protein
MQAMNPTERSLGTTGVMSKSSKVLIAAVFSVVVLVALLWGGDIIGDRQYKVEVVDSVPLYSLAPTDYPALNPVILTLPVGHHLRVLRVRYGKDFEALKVETEDGKVGWVIGGKGIRVTSRG